MIEQTRARILVIKLGALGDFVLAPGPFAALRTAHPDHGGVAEDAGRRIEALTAARNILLNQRSA